MRLTAIVLSLLIAVAAHARTSVESLLDALISRGNRAYELSQPAKIKILADSIAQILDSGALEGDALKDYSVSMYKLRGNYHYEKADLDSAEFYYDKAQSIIDDNPNTAFNGKAILLMLREMAQLHYRRGDYAKALAAMEQADDIMEYDRPYDVGDNNWLITKMTYAMCLARLKRFDEAMAIAAEELTNANDKSGLDYAKGQRMYAKIQLLADAAGRGALTAYKSYFATQKRYARGHFANMDANERAEYWQTLRPFVADCYLLESADPGFLYDITLFSKGLLLHISRLSGKGNAREDALRTLDYTWRDIQGRLGKAEAALEFIQYGEGSGQKMAALLLKSVGRPQFIPLASPAEVISAYGKWLDTTNRRDKDKLYSDSVLQSMVWTPELFSAIRGIDRLYFAPDGFLHRLAIEYMPQVENIEVNRLTSTRRLMERRTKLQADSPTLAFGSINYDLHMTPSQAAGNDSTAYSYYVGKSFPNLAASTDETTEIMQERHSANDSVVSGARASEYVFRQLAPDYSSILLSTHGDFSAGAPVSTDLKPVAGDDTMSRSIVAFAGINTSLSNPSFDASANCDGILSAKELAEMDLSRCKLFTASACQSALGELSSDGVYGLQRALKNAGVDAMLLSLWNVNSEATSKLMKEFYHNLSSGQPLRRAFSMARKKLLTPSPAETTGYVFDPATMAATEVTAKGQAFDAPQYANAFILIDAVD